MIARLRVEKLHFQGLRLTILLATTTLFAVAIAPSARGSTDYGPAVDKMLTCSKYYTSGFGKKFVVIHDMEGYYASGISYLRRCDLNASGGYNVAVSCHYVVNSDYNSDAPAGEITQLVREANYAWHARCWNQHSLGTEHEGFSSNPAWYTESMYQASALLQRHLCDKFGIPKDRNHVIAHGQKSVSGWPAWASANLGIDPNCNDHTDPGPYWNWSHFMDLLIGQVNNASVVSSSVPNSVPAGSTFSATITMNNNGTKAWTSDSSAHRLGSQGPQDNTRWGFSRVNLPGNVNPGGNAVFTFNATAPVTPGTYAFNWKMVEDTVEWFGATYTKNITVTTAGPTITTQPQSRTVNPGVNTNFTVLATGSGALTYQWRKDGNNISNGGKYSGATSPTLNVSNVQQTETGVYSVIVTDTNGPTTSASASLAVNTVTAFNETFETGNLNNWGLASNAAAPAATMLTISTAQNHTGGGTYSAYVNISTDRMYRNIGAEVAGRGKATFWIYDSGQTRVFTEVRSYAGAGWETGSLNQLLAIGKYNTVTLPGETFDVTKYQGRIVSGANAGWFNLDAAGAPSRSAGWHKFEIERLADFSTVNWYVDGILSRTFTGLTSPAWDCVVVGSVGAGTTAGDAWVDDFKVEYFDPPSITSNPTNKTVIAGNSATFTVAASGTVTGVQWRKNGVNLSNGGNISGATSTTLTINNAQNADAASYDAVVSNGAGPVNSTPATLKVAPKINTQPIASTNMPGDTATFTVAAAGQEVLTYQWRYNGTNLSDSLRVLGSATDTLTLTDVNQSDEGNYSVVVSNLAGSATSTAVPLVVLDPPVILTQPADVWVNLGSNSTFSVVAEGTAPLFYQWRFNDTNIVGATSSTYTVFNVGVNDSGGYSVEVSNLVDTVVSIDAVLNLIRPPPQIFGLDTSSNTFTLSWSALGGKTYRVQYKDNPEDPNWTDLAPDVTATGPTASKSDPIISVQRFYRILSLD